MQCNVVELDLMGKDPLSSLCACSFLPLYLSLWNLNKQNVFNLGSFWFHFSFLQIDQNRRIVKGLGKCTVSGGFNWLK